MEADRLTGELGLLGLEVVIGLETHIRLNTLTKLFCSCPNRENDEPNVNICPVCTGQMGVLPAVNKEAVRKAILFGKAIGSTMSNSIIGWDRKHYEYPDLPKNFQLTQFQKPVIPDGRVECYRNDGSTFVVEIEQVHIEEDAAKLIHDKERTLVDFNKAGVPLIEVVTRPCIHNLSDAPVYAQYLHRIVQTLNISEANLEKGEFKSDVSVSLRFTGSPDLNPRAEIKNLNSFRFMLDAINEEVKKQLDYFRKHNKFRPDQTTVLFDADLKQTRTMRKKEFAADYRFAAEPDIPLTDISKAVEEIRVDTAMLPFPVEKRLIEGGVRPQDAKFFTSDPVRSGVFMGVDSKVSDPLFVAKALSNNLKQEDYNRIQNVEALAGIISAFKSEAISVVLLQKAIGQLLDDPSFDFRKFIDEHTVPEERLLDCIREVITDNPETAGQIRSGDKNKTGILVGAVLSKIGKGIPGKIVREKLLAALSGEDQQAADRGAIAGSGQVEQITARSADIPDYEVPGGIKERYRTHVISDISADTLDSEVTLAGWVSSVRDHGELVFIDLRDTSNELFQLRLNRANFPDLDTMSRIPPESVIMAEGTVIRRSEDDFNPGIRTGSIELDTRKLDIINLSGTLPFELRRASKTAEAVRLKYKFLDHRSPAVRQTIINRHRVIKTIRDILDLGGFLEIETPVLSAGTDEGAREFIVPSRNFPGRFYTLPQAPQQFKQMLMLGGFGKYFQIARCFRDEDTRGDRQAEFTQLDIEVSFMGMQDIMDINTRLFNEVVEKTYGKKWKLFPFRVLTYREAMEKYGTDRPDLRYGLEMKDITAIVKDTSFQIFKGPIEAGGIVKCIRVSAKERGNAISKGQIEKLTLIAQENGLGGLAYIVVNKDGLQSPIIKYLGEDIAERIINEVDASAGDIVFFSASDVKTANRALDSVRQALAGMLHLINHRELHPAWVIDFPLFEPNDKGGWKFSHNPFSMPAEESLKDHMEGRNIGSIIAQQYDLVLNGYEIGGGSVRAHKPEIMAATYRNMGYSHEEMKKSIGHMYDAFHYGAPPHGGIAWGIDRLIMILENRSSIREVMAFPKTGTGEDLLFNSPSVLSSEKLSEANIRSILRSEGDNK